MQLVGAVETQIVEQHAVQAHFHLRPAGSERTQQVQIATNREVIARCDVQAGHRNRCLAARRHFLRDHGQRDPVDSPRAGVAQRKRHVQIQREGA